LHNGQKFLIEKRLYALRWA